MLVLVNKGISFLRKKVLQVLNSEISSHVQVNSSLAFLSSDVVGSSISHASIVICLSGFSVPESDLRVNILPSNTPSQIIEDLSKYVCLCV